MYKLLRPLTAGLFFCALLSAQVAPVQIKIAPADPQVNTLVGIDPRPGISFQQASANGIGGNLVGNNNIYTVGWSLPAAATNVTISAFVSPGASITAYLTTSIGQGTTARNEIAETSFTGVSGGSNDSTTIFNGLNLAAGTYYLTLAGSVANNAPNAPSWYALPNAPGPYITNSAGGGTGLFQGASGTAPGAPIALYPPASTFLDLTAEQQSGSPTWNALLFDVVSVQSSALPAATAGTPYSAALTATGSSGSYTWSAQIATGAPLPAWLSIDQSTGTLSGTPPASGTLALTITATDVQSNSSQQGMSIPINISGRVLNANLPSGMAIINISGTQDLSNHANGDLTWKQPFSSAGQLIEYTLPAGMYTFRVIDAADALAVFPALNQAETTAMWTAWTFNSPWLTAWLAFDSSATANANETQLFSGSEAGGGTNDAPSAYTGAINGGTESALYPLIRTATPQNTWYFPNPTTLIFSVPDDEGGDNQGGVSVLIAPAPAQPVSIITTSLNNGQVGVAYSIPNMAATGGSGVNSWTATGLPAGLSLSAAGVLGGTPTRVGNFNVTLTVTDLISGLTAQSAPLPIVIAGPVPALSITTSALPNGQVGVTYTTSVSAANGFGAYTWSLSPNSGLSINAATGQLSSAGPLTGNIAQFTVTVTDAAGDVAVRSFTVTANPAFAPLSITPAIIPDATVGVQYSKTLTAGGGSGNFSWSFNQDEGLNFTLTSAGEGQTATLSWVPTAVDPAAHVSVTLTDLSATPTQTVTNNYTFAINAAPPPLQEPAGITAWVIDDEGSLVAVTNGAASPVAFDNNCGCYDIARDAAGNLIVAAGDHIRRYTPSGALAGADILAPDQESSFYNSVAVDSFGNYIVADDGLHQVVRIDPATGAATVVYTYPVINQSDVEDAYVRVDAAGNYILAEDNSAEGAQALSIFRISPDGSQHVAIPIQPATNGGPIPVSVAGLTFDAQGNYVVGDWYSDPEGVYTITPAGSATVLLRNEIFSDLYGIARDPISGNYFLVDDDNDALYMFSADGSNLTTLLSGDVLEGNPTAVVVTSSAPPSPVDYILESDANIIRVGGSAAPVSCAAPVCNDTAYDFAADASGNFIIAAGGALAKVTPAGVTSSIASAPEESKWFSVAIDANGNDIVADVGQHQLLKVTPAGAVTPIVAPYPVATPDRQEHAYVRLDGAGNYILAHDNGETVRIFRITPVGVVTEITLSGMVPGTISGLTFDANGNYVISDPDEARIYLITPAGAASRLVPDPGEILEFPAGIFRDPVTGRYLLVDDDEESLFSISADGTQIVSIADAPDDSIAVLSIGASPLTITTLALPAGTQGQLYSSGPLSATGGSGSYQWRATGLPAGLSMSLAGVISGSVPANAPAVSSVAVTATDANNASLSTTKTFQLSIGSGAPPPPPAPPALTISSSTSSIQTKAGGQAGASFTASGGVPPYTFSATGLPPGVTLASGSLSGSPSQTGTFNATVTVNDSRRTSAQASVTIYVLGLTAASLPGGTAGQTYSGTVGAVGGSDGYSFSATGVPAGLSFSSGGALTGTPATAGSYSLTVTVASAGVSVSGPFSVTIAAPLPLSVTTTSLADGTINTRYSQPLGAHGGLPPYTWAIIAGSLPAGLSMTSSGIVSGTPTAPGTASFGAQVTDRAGATATGTVTLAIHPAPLVITAQSLPPGMATVDYPVQLLTATGGVAPYTWSAGGATSLPGGMTFSTSGALSGVPASAGSYSLAATVTDAAGAKASATLGLTVRPQSTDLILTASSLQFSMNAPAASTPGGQTVGVQSTVASQPISYTYAMNPAVSWLSVSGGASTPDTLQVSLTPAALALTAGDYQASITATCTSSACSGHKQTVAADLTITNAPAKLTIGTTLLSFATTISASGPLGQSINIQNTGGGTIGFASVSCEAPWCTTGAAPATLAGGASGTIAVTVDPSVVTPGFYRTQADIVSSAGRGSVPVTLFVAPSSTMTLAPAGQQFNMPAGSSPGNPNGSFLVSVNSTTANWTATVLPGAPWLKSATASGSSTSTQPGTVSFSIDPATAAALAPGAYYGLIEITSPDLSNSPQDFEAILNVVPASTPLVPDPEPGGLLFITSAGGTLPPQTVSVYSGSTSPLTFQTSAATSDGANWLSVTPDTGSAAAGSPGVTTVNVGPSGLKAGVYHGGVSYSLSATAVRTVNATLIVTSAPASSSERPAPAASGTFTAKAAGCVASKLAPAQTGLVNNFSQPAAWPTPVVIQLSDDCGAAVTNGQVVATFSNGDPPLALPLADPGKGLYSGTWSPRNTGSQISINLRASAPGLADAISQISGAVTPNAAPVLTPHGTLHSFDPLVGAALAPGTIVQIYGENLASQTAQPSAIPLPPVLNGTSVIIGGIESPLYFVSAGQVNAQIPFELEPGKQYQVILSANGALTTPDTIQLSQATPGLAAFADGTLIAQHGDGTLVSNDSPAKANEYLVAYGAGMGGTNATPESGAASPLSPLAQPSDPPTLLINGAPAPLLFAGLTPGLVGLYQINFQVPASLAAGNITISVTQDGLSSNETVLPYLP